MTESIECETVQKNANIIIDKINITSLLEDIQNDNQYMIDKKEKLQEAGIPIRII